jgi:hypothetical protein
MKYLLNDEYSRIKIRIQDQLISESKYPLEKMLVRSRRRSLLSHIKDRLFQYLYLVLALFKSLNPGG